MTACGDGFQRVEVRSMWPNEAYDFTPWLAEHLDLLGAELEFTQLLHDREQTDADATAPQWSWRRYDRWAFHSISIRRDGAIHDPPEEREAIRAWMLDRLPRLKAVFDPRVEAILGRMPAGGG